MIHVFKRKNIRINKNLLQVNQEKVNCYKQKKPQEGESFSHMMHVCIEQEELVIQQQEMPGDCILCDLKIFGCYSSHMEDHYRRRCYSKSLKIYNHLILHCKCKEVPYRGLDNYMRNSHWHCPDCYKPVNDRMQLAQHLKQKHNYHSTIIDELCSKVYPHW